MHRTGFSASRPEPGFAYLAWRTSGPDPAFDEPLGVELVCDGEEPAALSACIDEGDRDAGGAEDAALPLGDTEGSSARARPSALRARWGTRPVLCADARVANAWWMRAFGPSEAPPRWVALSALRALLFPTADEVPPGWSAAPCPAAPDLAALSAGALREVLESWLRAHLERPAEVRRFALSAWGRAAQAARAQEQPSAPLLATLVARLGAEERRRGALESEERLPVPASLLGRAEPAFSSGLEALLEEPPRARQRGPHELVPRPCQERELVEQVFREALPRALGASTASEAAPLFRPGQLELAQRIGDAHDAQEFLLVDAPTGTGKTLAYAVPSLLFAVRADLRLGISTYTRTLQDQAYYRELPRAARLLGSLGWAHEPRIALLKGRSNYVCARVLGSLAPEADDPLEEHLAWTALALFALVDPLGDFDRLPRHASLELRDERAYEAALARLRSEAAAEPLCCRRRSERARCAAFVARKRAERAHVIVTNHAFVLSDPGFFAHLVFDECDHLHRQTASSASREIDARDLRREARRLAGRAGLLERLHALFPGSAQELYGDPVAEALQGARSVSAELELELDDFEERVRAFLLWRGAREGERPRGARHELLREYSAGELGEPLVAAQRRLLEKFGAFSTKLATLQDELAHESGRGVARLRTRLARSLTGLGEIAADVSAWLPLGDSGPRFDPAYHYDVESGEDGGWKLVQRILLPQVFLGRHLFPRLGHAVLLSASTWLRGGFDTMKAYLGLSALEQAETERATREPDERAPDGAAPRAVATFRAPSAFDYCRAVLVVPEDAPPYASSGFGKQRYLDYVVRYLGFLGERSRGRLLGLFTNAQDLDACARRLAAFFRARGIRLYWQGMPGRSKEELAELFRGREPAVLLGLDTFWYGVDFPGETLEQVVMVKLPYGPIDRFQEAQAHALGGDVHRRHVYLPHASAMFRQGFGRLLRRVDDRGAVHVLDRRILEARHRFFLKELPGYDQTGSSRPLLFVGASGACVERALLQAGRLEELRRLGLGFDFEPGRGPRGQGPTKDRARTSRCPGGRPAGAAGSW
ncbi:MAG: hypothetical protein IPN34_09595 [Planctomycetes bacterium]|nr:hypothetical protein [Planctomycetota bacterium]